MQTTATAMQLAFVSALADGYQKWTHGTPSKTAAQVYVRRHKAYFDALNTARPHHIGFSRTKYADKAIVERLNGGKA